jgi:hypothetical protein
MKQMKAMRLVLLMLGVVTVGCPPQTTNTSVVVVDSAGAPVAGAEVFLAKKNEAAKATLQGSTDAAGGFVFSPGLSSGDQLFARRRVYEHPSYRPDHGPGAGWVEHVYQTSRVVNDGGSVIDLTVTNPIGTQTLTVSPGNVLIGWHLVVSLDWDASEDEFGQLRTRFVDASDYLYNLTDGQFFIEQVEIADDAQLWGSAEIAFQVDAWVQPHSTSIAVSWEAPVPRPAPTSTWHRSAAMNSDRRARRRSFMNSVIWRWGYRTSTWASTPSARTIALRRGKAVRPTRTSAPSALAPRAPWTINSRAASCARRTMTVPTVRATGNRARAGTRLPRATATPAPELPPGIAGS